MGLTIHRLGPCGTRQHWLYKVEVPVAHADGWDVVYWCREQLGDNGSRARWDFFIGIETSLCTILLADDDAVFHLKMRWA